MQINENLLRVSAGKIVIDRELKIDTDVSLLIQGQVVKTEDQSNQDGTINRIYVIKGIIAEAVQDGKTIKDSARHSTPQLERLGS